MICRWCFQLIGLTSIACISEDVAAPVLVGTEVVQFPDGALRGEQLVFENPEFAHYLRFRGIQYAQHPVGQLRWQPPQPVQAWQEVRNATAFGDDCPNLPLSKKAEYIGKVSMSESCLFLNLWAPQATDGAALPVFVWIHGGSFRSGGSTMYPGDGIMALRRGAVVVTANYRLGALGFMGGSAVARSTTDGSAGNFALQDSREALHWIQKNIAAVSGDPQRVVLWGQSSGSSMVSAHLVMPRSAGLFQFAIMESGAFDNYTVQGDVEDVDANFNITAHRAGCGEGTPDERLSCLKALPLEPVHGPGLWRAVAAGSRDNLFSPVVDGVELLASPEELAAMGRINPVQAVILGTERNEGKYFLKTSPEAAPYTDRQQFLEWMLDQWDPSVVEDALKLYPNDSNASDRTSWWNLATEVYTDSEYACPAQRSADWLVSAGVPAQRVFVYEFQYVREYYTREIQAKYREAWCTEYLYCEAAEVSPGVGHHAQVDFVWARMDHFDKSADLQLSRQMLEWWQSFAATADPNLPDQPGLWQPWSSDRSTLVIDSTSQSVPRSRAAVCDLWASAHKVPYNLTQPAVV